MPEIVSDSVLRPEILALLADTLDADAPGDITPPLWHWTAFHPKARSSELGRDGHPRVGIIPNPPFPRRMFAGGQVTYTKALPVNVPILRTTTTTEPELKTGRSGTLAFMTMTHTYSVDGEVLAVEDMNVVYREDPPESTDNPPTPPPSLSAHDGAKTVADTDTSWSQTRTFTPAHLFRYSALTFNTHRIHYDAPYVTQVEGHPNIVVHGPLLITSLTELVRERYGNDAIHTVSYRMQSPAYADQELVFAATKDAGSRDIALTGTRGDTTLVTASVTLRDSVTV
jgi:3-methylfumaryl-CoA hydratase